MTYNVIVVVSKRLIFIASSFTVIIGGKLIVETFKEYSTQNTEC